MTRWGAMVVVVLLGCAKKEFAPGPGGRAWTCDDYGDHLVELAKDDAELGPSVKSGRASHVRDVMVADCARERWDPDELGCVMAAKTIDEMTDCAIRKR